MRNLLLTAASALALTMVAAAPASQAQAGETETTTTEAIHRFPNPIAAFVMTIMANGTMPARPLKWRNINAGRSR